MTMSTASRISQEKPLLSSSTERSSSQVCTIRAAPADVCMKLTGSPSVAVRFSSLLPSRGLAKQTTKSTANPIPYAAFIQNARSCMRSKQTNTQTQAPAKRFSTPSVCAALASPHSPVMLASTYSLPIHVLFPNIYSSVLLLAPSICPSHQCFYPIPSFELVFHAISL